MKTTLFYGREQELQSLASALQDQSLILVTGQSGIGKSSLVAHYLHQNKSFIETLYVNCNESIQLADLICKISLKLETHVAPDFTPLHELTETFLDELEKLNIILIIDNFQRVQSTSLTLFLEQIQSVLCQSVVILISNKLLDIEDECLLNIFEIRMKALNDHDSMALCQDLLKSHSFSSSKSLKNIIRKLGGHPLFIRFFVSQIIFGKASFDELILDQSKIELFTKDYITKTIYNHLSLKQREVLFTLCQLRVHIGRQQLEDIIDPDQSIEIEILINCFFIEIDSSGALYVHDLLKLFILTQHENSQEDLDVQIARSFINKKTNSITDFIEVSHHFFKGKEYDLFVKSIRQSTEVLILSYDGLEYFLIVLDDYLALCPEDIKSHLIECKLKILIYLFRFDECSHLIEAVGPSLQNLFQGFLAYTDHEDTKALQFWQNFLLQFSDDRIFETISTRFWIARAQLRLQQKDCAIKTIEETLKIQSQNLYIVGTSHFNAYSFLAPIDFNLAIQHLFQADKIISKSCPNTSIYPRIQVRMAEYKFVYLNEIDCALELTRSAYDLYKSIFPGAHFINSKILESQILMWNQQADKALDILNQLEKVHSKKDINYINIVTHKGTALLILKQFDQSASCLKQIIEYIKLVDYGNPNTYLAYAQYLIGSHHLEELIDIFEDEEIIENFEPYPVSNAQRLNYLVKVYQIKGKQSQLKALEEQLSKLLKSLSTEESSALFNKIDRFEKAVFNESIPKFLSYTNVKKEELTLKTLSKLQRNPKDWNVFIDFSEKSAYIAGQRIPLFSKGKLAQILQEIVLYDGLHISSRELYEKCWNSKYNPDIDGALRTSMTRLKKLLHQGLDKTLIESVKKGSYHLNKNIKYCFIIANTR
ncbi:ATP-binding protein [bacterium]|nr:ATP-binding protein [bacterium]